MTLCYVISCHDSVMDYMDYSTVELNLVYAGMATACTQAAECGGSADLIHQLLAAQLSH